MRAEREAEEARFPMEKFLAVDGGAYVNQERAEEVLPGTTWTRLQADQEQRRIAERTLELEQIRYAGIASDPAVALGLVLHLAKNSSILLDYQSVRRETWRVPRVLPVAT
eukprot:3010664-Heterocapsa_arctica.AAC.1